MLRPGWLTALELVALVVWVGLVGVRLWEARDKGTLAPIDPAALSAGEASETWMGIYFQDQKVGYAVNSETPTVDGGLLVRHRSTFQVAAMGELRRVITAGDAVLDEQLRLQRFELFFSSEGARLSARGELVGQVLKVELHQAGEVSTLELPMAEAPQMSLSLPAWFAARGEVKVGDRFQTPYFDPLTMTQGDMEVTVTDVVILPGGDEAWWLTRSYDGLSTRTLVNNAGRVLREEGALGMAMVVETEAQATQLGEQKEPVDLIGLSAVPLDGRLPDARTRGVLTLQILGVDPSRIPHRPPVQTVTGDQVRLSAVTLPELPGDLPVREQDPALAEYLVATPLLPVDHRELQEQSAALLDGVQDRRAAAQAILDFVYRSVEKTPTIGVPNALEVLRSLRGDCNEHTALYVALARAAGLPARIAAGLVWSDRVGKNGAFYYHAWPEVWMGQAGWVPVDPTFGQLPADATHVKLVEGDLDRQIEIMGVMGRLSFRLVDPAP